MNIEPLSNPRYEAFAHAMAMGKTLADALRTASYKPHPPSGARLLKNVKISERIAYLKAKSAKERDEALTSLAKKEALTREWVLDNLMRNARICMGVDATPDGHQPAGANKALELLGKELGMFVEQSKNTNINYNLTDEATEEEWTQEHVTAH